MSSACQKSLQDFFARFKTRHIFCEAQLHKKPRYARQVGGLERRELEGHDAGEHRTADSAAQKIVAAYVLQALKKDNAQDQNASRNLTARR